MKLWMVLYVSQASVDVTPAVLTDLVKRAQNHNAMVGMTGALLYYRGRFMQVLEGDREAVDPCMTRIARDTRHHDVNIVYQGPIGDRQFGDWSMREVVCQGVNEPAVQDFWRRLVNNHDSQTLATALKLMQRLASRSLPPVS